MMIDMCIYIYIKYIYIYMYIVIPKKIEPQITKVNLMAKPFLCGNLPLTFYTVPGHSGVCGQAAWEHGEEGANLGTATGFLG